MTSYPRSIYQPLIDDGERIINQLMITMENYMLSIERVKRARATAKYCADDLARMESEHVAEMIVQAELGNGPLAGIAKTSKAYQFALDNVLAKARRNGLKHYADLAQDAQLELVDAEISYEQEAARFSALKHAADLQAAMINGTRA